LGGFGSGGLETVQVGGGLAVGFLDAGDEALEAQEEFGVVLEGVAEFEVLGKICAHAVNFEEALPDLGFGSEEAAEAPGVGDHQIDEFVLAGVGRVAGLGEVAGEGPESFGVFARDDLLDGVDARLEGVPACGGFAFGGLWSGGKQRISAICFDLNEG